MRDVYFGFKWCLHLVKQVLETCILKPWKSAYKVCNLEILQILDFSSLGSYIYKERERDFMKQYMIECFKVHEYICKKSSSLIINE